MYTYLTFIISNSTNQTRRRNKCFNYSRIFKYKIRKIMSKNQEKYLTGMDSNMETL